MIRSGVRGSVEPRMSRTNSCSMSLCWGIKPEASYRCRPPNPIAVPPQNPCFGGMSETHSLTHQVNPCFSLLNKPRGNPRIEAEIACVVVVVAVVVAVVVVLPLCEADLYSLDDLVIPWKQVRCPSDLLYYITF